MAKVLITTVPFAQTNKKPLDLLNNAQIDYLINPLNKKITEEELFQMVGDFDIIIAGTEKISAKVMDKANNLKFISRVGIGLDGVDLNAAKQRDILVSYTPDAPAPAVAELTIGLMLTTLRSVHVANSQMHKGKWHRYFGRRLSEVTVGIIGVGRIGTKVLNYLQCFHPKNIIVNDLVKEDNLNLNDNINWVSKETIYRQADIISLHVPLTNETHNLIDTQQLALMKPDAILINTARGGIINEKSLFNWMSEGKLYAVAIDVFEQEPYCGDLNSVDRCLLTSHMGSMSIDCRSQMEIEATLEAIRFVQGVELQGLVS